MKRNIIVALLVAAVCCLSFPAGAQDSRNVSGCVYDENGTALANVIVRVDDSDLQFTTDENGRFEGQVGIYNNYLTAEKNGYKPRKQAIDGTYLIFRLTRTLTAEELQALADARARKLAEYDRKYKNHGLVQSVSFLGLILLQRVSGEGMYSLQMVTNKTWMFFLCLSIISCPIGSIIMSKPVSDSVFCFIQITRMGRTS